MEIDMIFKIAGIGIVVAIINQILSRADKGEYTVLITLSGLIIIVLLLVPEINNLLDSLRDMVDF